LAEFSFGELAEFSLGELEEFFTGGVGKETGPEKKCDLFFSPSQIMVAGKIEYFFNFIGLFKTCCSRASRKICILVRASTLILPATQFIIQSIFSYHKYGK